MPVRVSLTNAGVDGMIDESLSGRRVPPSEMEVAQDAVSVAYSLVQRHLASFGNLNVPGSNPPGGEQGPNAIAEVCLALARTLSTEALSREAAVSAGTASVIYTLQPQRSSRQRICLFVCLFKEPTAHLFNVSVDGCIGNAILLH